MLAHAPHPRRLHAARLLAAVPPRPAPRHQLSGVRGTRGRRGAAVCVDAVADAPVPAAMLPALRAVEGRLPKAIGAAGRQSGGGCIGRWRHAHATRPAPCARATCAACWSGSIASWRRRTRCATGSSVRACMPDRIGFLAVRPGPRAAAARRRASAIRAAAHRLRRHADGVEGARCAARGVSAAAAGARHARTLRRTRRLSRRHRSYRDPARTAAVAAGRDASAARGRTRRFPTRWRRWTCWWRRRSGRRTARS